LLRGSGIDGEQTQQSSGAGRSQGRPIHVGGEGSGSAAERDEGRPPEEGGRKVIAKFHKAGCDEKDCTCPWRLTYRPDGRTMKRLNFRTRKEAEAHEAATKVQASRGEYIDPRKVPTFGDAAEKWFQTMTDRRVSQVANLRNRLDNHILPRFGTLRLNQISVDAIEKFRNDLRDAGKARNTYRPIVGMVKSIFGAAVRRGELAQNPADKMAREFKGSRELAHDETGADEEGSIRDVLSGAEVAQLCSAAKEGLDRTLFATAFVTGAREGELFGLRWSDVDFEAGKVRITRTLSWACPKGEARRPRFYEPKTKSGKRTITVPASLLSALKVWKLACPVGELVFPREDGSPMSRETVAYRFKVALQRAGLRQVRFHDLRHSCASELIANGAQITEVQHQLGHADAAITLRVYSHWIKKAEASTADKLADVLFADRPKLRAVK
jgi:integrase